MYVAFVNELHRADSWYLQSIKAAVMQGKVKKVRSHERYVAGLNGPTLCGSVHGGGQRQRAEDLRSNQIRQNREDRAALCRPSLLGLVPRIIRLHREAPTSSAGAFGIIALIIPTLATIVYGGDGEYYYSNDWVKCSAVSNIALAVSAFMMSQWHKTGGLEDAIR